MSNEVSLTSFGLILYKCYWVHFIIWYVIPFIFCQEKYP